MASVMKWIVAYMLMLLATLGWGITKPYLDHYAVLKVQVVCSMYIVLEFLREYVLSYRLSHALSSQFSLLCMMPVVLVSSVMFFWIYSALKDLTQELKDSGRHEKMFIADSLWKVLLVALALTTSMSP